MIWCNKCKDFKDEKDFYKNKNGKFLKPCKKCKLLYASKLYHINKDDNLFKARLRQIRHKYYLKNKEAICEKTSAYYANNKQYYIRYRNDYEKKYPRKFRKRGIASIKQKIRSNISRSISKRLNKFGKKDQSIIKYLSFSFDELKEHFQSLFESWMSWGNYGIYNPKIWKDDDQSTWTWQIDHIIPHSFFDYTSMKDASFKECWALKNLRPYSAKQNILDGDRR